MRRFALAMLVLILTGASVRAQDPQLKGLAALSRELSARIAPRDDPLELDIFIPADGLDDLAGTWSTFGTQHKFQNGTPNPVNMVIMQAALSGFAASLGESCATPQLSFHPQFLEILRNLCKWPAASAKADAVMRGFWVSIMGYDAPMQEYDAWRSFMRREYGERPAAETIEAMTLAITMNPYFLMDK
ncbi:MAG: hypothetical protein AB7S92_01700 [Parvibaculaceae bacterium]